jgi:hypothetical protein
MCEQQKTVDFFRINSVELNEFREHNLLIRNPYQPPKKMKFGPIPCSDQLFASVFGKSKRFSMV